MVLQAKEKGDRREQPERRTGWTKLTCGATADSAGQKARTKASGHEAFHASADVRHKWQEAPGAGAAPGSAAPDR